MAALKFFERHNSVVPLSLAGHENAAYHPIISFLMRSRIYHVLTHNPTVIGAYVRDFWESASYDSAVNPPVIRATVSGRDLQFSQADLRETLHLGDAAIDDGPVELPAALRQGALLRMGYNGDVTKSIAKGGLFGQWRYFVHVIIQCLSARKSGFDHVNVYEQSIMVALTYNKPLSLSRYFFDIFRNMIDGAIRDRFLLFPRFVMMIIFHYHPDIPMIADTLQVCTIAARIFKDCRFVKANSTPRHEVALFGHLIDETYVASPHDGWEDVGTVAQPPPQPQQPPVPQSQQQPPVQQLPQPIPQPQQSQSPPQAAAAEVLHDIFTQVEQPAAIIDVEDLTDAILNPDMEDVLRQIDEFSANPDDDVNRQQDQWALRDAGANSTDEGSDDGSDDADKSPTRLGLYGSKVVLLKKGSDVGSSSRKRKTSNEDADFDPEVDRVVKPRKKSKGSCSAPPVTLPAASSVPVTTPSVLPPHQFQMVISVARQLDMLETKVESLSSKLVTFDQQLKAQQAEHERQL